MQERTKTWVWSLAAEDWRCNPSLLCFDRRVAWLDSDPAPRSGTLTAPELAGTLFINP